MPPYQQFSTVKNLGENHHFPLEVSDEADLSGVSRYVFLTEYNESFDSTWEIPTRAYARLNPDFRFVNTTRKVTLGFNLGARNVKESQQNLDFCQYIAQRVYGKYTSRQRVDGSSRSNWSYEGANLSTRITFGNLLNYETVYITNYSFTPEFDAGVFNYSSEAYRTATEARRAGVRETDYVYHRDKGKIYPKLVSVSISFVVLSEFPLGWGGPLRGEGDRWRWASNDGSPWPHGVANNYQSNLEYMKQTASPRTQEYIAGIPNPGDQEGVPPLLRGKGYYAWGNDGRKWWYGEDGSTYPVTDNQGFMLHGLDPQHYENLEGIVNM